MSIGKREYYIYKRQYVQCSDQEGSFHTLWLNKMNTM